ncbi:MAG: hypothetical protein JSV39_01415 [Candidatus Aenigmatarchaeota archaeon]|nr:MAG: hypothetical protein JSV39_01415 [Candidatus Aenigmarchaeota archaeon]
MIGKSQKASTLISPICECGHSSVKPPRMVAEKNGYLLRAECYNDYCDVKRYELNLTDPRRLNIHYMVATVRDLCKKGETEKADIHVFGGDYMLRSYKKGEEPKIVKVTKFLDGISNDPPKVYVGPLLLYNKKRIRKSIESCFTLDCIEQKRPDWAEGLHRMLEDHLEDFVIDMSGMDKYFS